MYLEEVVQDARNSAKAFVVFRWRPQWADVRRGPAGWTRHRFMTLPCQAAACRGQGHGGIMKSFRQMARASTVGLRRVRRPQRAQIRTGLVRTAPNPAPGSLASGSRTP
jgi:hypothetical protein